MDYKNISDFEINCAVAKILGFQDLLFFEVDSEICNGPVWDVASGVTECGLSIYKGCPFSPVESWHYAGPLIEKYGISLYHQNGNWEAELEYEAPVGIYGTDETCSRFLSGKNPRRVAMLVLLIMLGELE